MVYAEIDGRGPRVVLVHGFTQTRRSWGPVAVDLARDHEVVRGRRARSWALRLPLGDHGPRRRPRR